MIYRYHIFSTFITSVVLTSVLYVNILFIYLYLYIYSYKKLCCPVCWTILELYGFLVTSVDVV